MSGIVGIFERDGAPVDRPLLQGLTRFLSDRGPDARETWSDGCAGFGHTLLRTTRESLSERQPAGLDGRYWITADARLDARAGLLAELEAAGRRIGRGAPDCELLLHAYAAWSERCVEHLRGDFAFAVWDARHETLFCARDHFGVKPFYYAKIGDLFLFSNTLNCLRLHPGVSDELNEAAIADFLLFGLNCDLATTTFRDIRRLPPAHFLVASAEGVRTARYWSVPIDGRIRYKREGEYFEHLQTVLKAAVADRLRTDRVGILLSGGLDSSSIAAMAREISAESGGSPELRAYTVMFESLIPDEDSAHARTVAEFLHIPHRTMSRDGLRLFERWDGEEAISPEPVDDPFFAGLFDQFGLVAQDCRVALGGEGSDNLMHFQMLPYVRDLARNRQWSKLARDVAKYWSLRSSPWPGIRRRIRRALDEENLKPALPRWIAPDFAARVQLEARWKAGESILASQGHPTFPAGHASLSLPQWSRYFELCDPGVTRRAVEVRHPFMDLRVASYLLALPPFPWAFQKKILRDAMAGRLPETVRVRAKASLPDPTVEALRRREPDWVARAHWSEHMKDYVQASALPVLSELQDPESAGVEIRPYCLNFWLRSVQPIRYKVIAEAHCA